jgi:hypothetical protein
MSATCHSPVTIRLMTRPGASSVRSGEDGCGMGRDSIE